MTSKFTSNFPMRKWCGLVLAIAHIACSRPTPPTPGDDPGNGICTNASRWPNGSVAPLPSPQPPVKPDPGVAQACADPTSASCSQLRDTWHVMTDGFFTQGTLQSDDLLIKVPIPPAVDPTHTTLHCAVPVSAPCFGAIIST